MIPTLIKEIKEYSVRPFCFYREGGLYEGMRYENKLYQLIETFTLQEKTWVDQFSSHLAQKGKQVIITQSGRRYRVWADLQTESRESAAIPC